MQKLRHDVKSIGYLSTQAQNAVTQAQELQKGSQLRQTCSNLGTRFRERIATQADMQKLRHDVKSIGCLSTQAQNAVTQAQELQKGSQLRQTCSNLGTRFRERIATQADMQKLRHDVKSIGCLSTQAQNAVTQAQELQKGSQLRQTCSVLGTRFQRKDSNLGRHALTQARC